MTRSRTRAHGARSPGTGPGADRVRVVPALEPADRPAVRLQGALRVPRGDGLPGARDQLLPELGEERRRADHAPLRSRPALGHRGRPRKSSAGPTARWSMPWGLVLTPTGQLQRGRGRQHATPGADDRRGDRGVSAVAGLGDPRIAAGKRDEAAAHAAPASRSSHRSVRAAGSSIRTPGCAGSTRG